ncbi:MAG TPA: hypothetical protein VKA48_03650, partial [Gammaproteobacteria bacterium]|nr:hypothetical protein [Gammaproteobacteria bacterium]
MSRAAETSARNPDRNGRSNGSEPDAKQLPPPAGPNERKAAMSDDQASVAERFERSDETLRDWERR